MGKTLDEFGLDRLIHETNDEIRRTRDIVDALDAPIPDVYKQACLSLNPKQQDAFDSIMEHVTTGQPGAFFVDGPGGTGKTYLYCALYAATRAMGKIVLPTATSGITESNIVIGRTTHSRFKIPIDLAVSTSCSVPKQISLAALLKETCLIIWDEASMAKKENIEAADILLRDLCSPSLPFGGKVIVFGGDFRQVLPVVPRKSQSEAMEASLVSSSLWNQFKRFRLTDNMRERTDSQFADFLLAMGNGQLQTAEIEQIQVPGHIIVPYDESNVAVDSLTDFVFLEIKMTASNEGMFVDRAILTPLNAAVDDINSTLIDEFPGESVCYKSYDLLLDDTGNVYPTEFLNTLSPGGMSPHELVLKENCPVILLRNLAPASGLCNVTRMLCKNFYPNIIECAIITGHHAGEHVFIPRINLRPSETLHYPFKFQRKQFPIKLSFTMTINKAQGQTLSQVGLYLNTPCFSHGQLYVGLSRAQTSAQIKVLSKPTTDQVSTTTVRNVVSFSILEKADII
ncbi:ATP-dependent DNA helicase PIF1-like [Chenopodium quinoa]|uniref:ATP-dependent DNA helicase PIF1-like n=1 Tax=Chenopodium quinoa TaxID=63459 RepID=UPI000B77A2AC|nr:ATP-dependent DNA helicase PIF1-like [Chenopodium quinoa]